MQEISINIVFATLRVACAVAVDPVGQRFAERMGFALVNADFLQQRDKLRDAQGPAGPLVGNAFHDAVEVETVGRVAEARADDAIVDGKSEPAPIPRAAVEPVLIQILDTDFGKGFRAQSIPLRLSDRFGIGSAAQAEADVFEDADRERRHDRDQQQHGGTRNRHQ